MKFRKMLAVVSALGMMCAVPFLPEAVQESAVITAKADKTYKNLTYFVNYDNTIMITGYTGSIEGELVIPDKIDGMPVTAIEKNAFISCEMTSVVLPETVTEIGERAFYACTNLTSITLPEGVTKIEYGTFESCTFTSFIIPETVTEIGDRAFESCSELTSIVIPETVTEIGDIAFDGCFNLSSVTIKNKDCFIHLSNPCTLGIPGRTAIIGYDGSTAHTFAEQYDYKFVVLKESSTESEIQDLKVGDADGSGEIDILDVITVNKAILGKENLSENGLKAIDFNGNGKPDSSESLTILKYIVGMITDFNA